MSLAAVPSQRLLALQRANETRSSRARIKRDLKAGRVSIRALIADPPSVLDSAVVFDTLLSAPKYGRVNAAKVLSQCGIPPGRTFGGLSDRQRRELLALVKDYRPSVGYQTSSLLQRLEALQRANDVRLARSDVHRSIVCGDLSVRDVLADPPECVASLAVGVLLGFEPRWGEVRVRRLLSRLSPPTSGLRPVGLLTVRQRLLIAERMG